MAVATVSINFMGPGNYTLSSPESGKVASLLMVAVTNLGGVSFQFRDSDSTQLTGPLMLADLQQFVTNFGTVAVPLCATAAGKGLNLSVLDGGRLTGFAVIDIS